MKRLVLVLFVALAVSASLPAQQASFLNLDRSAQPLFLAPAADASNGNLVPSLAVPAATLPVTGLSPAPSAALPEAPRAPQYGSSGDFGYRWDLAVGYEYVHFESKPFSANLSGIHTSIAYSLNEWFALEGSLVSAFGGDVFQDGEMSKYVLFTGGGRIFWNRQPHRLSPWAHILAGMTHMNPQIANSSKISFALQAGGGIDWYFNPRLSFRGEADFVHTQLYSDSQNNYQAGVGLVLHF
jgi:Outer membrane protein beta-barrel domain